MALVQAALQSDLLSVFMAMKDGTKDDAWLANQVGRACMTYYSSIMLAGSGAAVGSGYTGTASLTAGTSTVVGADMEGILVAQFKAMLAAPTPDCSVFCNAIQLAYTTMVSKNVVSYAVVGTVTIAGTPPVVSPCSGTYTVPVVFPGLVSIAATLLPQCNGMGVGTTEADLAGYLAAAIHTATMSGVVAGTGVLVAPAPGTVAIVGGAVS